MSIISDTKRLAKKHGIKISLINERSITPEGETTSSNGYFCPDDKILAVAVAKPKSEWLPIFTHESCHLDQSIENKYLWNKWNVGYTMFFDWIEGRIKLDNKILKSCVQDIIDCELDCEKRTVRKIKKYNLDISIVNYKRMANTYLYSYPYMMKVQKWKTGIYMNKWLCSDSPTSFQKDYFKIPLKLQHKFKKFYEI